MKNLPPVKSRKNNLIQAFAVGALFANSMGIAFAGTSADHEHTHTSEPSITIGHKVVNGNVSVIMGLDGFAGGNVGVSSGPDGLLIVDDMLPGFEHKLEDVLDTLKTCQDCGDLKYLINTHWHFDHAGNNEHFGDDTVLIAHESARALMAVEQNIKALNMAVPATKKGGLPDFTFVKKSSVHFNGEEIELMHFPNSHTSGDIAAYFKQSKVLHLGDLFFNGMFPFIDLEHGGNVKGMIKSIKTVLESYPADIKIIPGHGAVTDMKQLRSFLQMLEETTKVVQKAKNAGINLQAIQKQGLNERWDSWAWPFISTETWIAQVYKSL